MTRRHSRCCLLEKTESKDVRYVDFLCCSALREEMNAGVEFFSWRRKTCNGSTKMLLHGPLVAYWKYASIISKLLSNKDQSVYRSWHLYRMSTSCQHPSPRPSKANLLYLSGNLVVEDIQCQISTVCFTNKMFASLQQVLNSKSDM